MSPSYAYPEVIVSTDWVASHLNDPSIVIVEINTNLIEGYDTGHVPSSIGWSLHIDLEDRVRRDIPRIEQMESLLKMAGISKETTIVLYGDGNNRSATWAFWILKIYRHEDVRIMDGGRQKWLKEGRELSTDSVSRAPSHYQVATPDRSIRAMRDYIIKNLGKQGFKLLDTRTIEEFTGKLSSAPGIPQSEIYRNGRIPGAIHIAWDDAVSLDGSFRPVEELRKLYEEQDLSSSDEIVPYCRLGVRASYSWFVLKYLLGYPRVRNYDGSWTEWGNSVGVPVDSDEPSTE